MPLNLTDLKPSSIPKKTLIFEDNEELSYMKTFGRPDAIVLDILRTKAVAVKISMKLLTLKKNWSFSNLIIRLL